MARRDDWKWSIIILSLIALAVFATARIGAELQTCRVYMEREGIEIGEL